MSNIGPINKAFIAVFSSSTWFGKGKETQRVSRSNYYVNFIIYIECTGQKLSLKHIINTHTGCPKGPI